MFHLNVSCKSNKIEMKNTTSVINTELFTIPIENNKYIIYAPLTRAAFIGNTGMVNHIAGLIDERYNDNSDLNNSLLEFLRRLEIIDGNPEKDRKSVV